MPITYKWKTAEKKIIVKETTIPKRIEVTEFKPQQLEDDLIEELRFLTATQQRVDDLTAEIAEIKTVLGIT